MKTHFQTSTAKLVLTTVAVVFLVLPIGPLQARTYDPNNIFSDQELYDSNSLSQAAIQHFLERENSALARFSQSIEGVTKQASTIIWEISQKNTINPKFLLTTLEKEQALISRPQATEKALDWATGYSCFNGGCNEKHQGFLNQVEATAETQQIYTAKRSQFGFRVNVTTQSHDGLAVTPQNQATANLFIYTPYVGYSPELGVTSPFGGNRLFWRVWHRYFSHQPYLDGQVVRYNGNYWLIRNNQKQRFTSQEIFSADYADSAAIGTTQEILNAYPDGPEIHFANNTVVRADSGQYYLLADSTKRLITNEATALALGDTVRVATSGSGVQSATSGQLSGYTDGAQIDSADSYPTGQLYRDSSGSLWLVENNLRRPVDSAVWQSRFKSATPQTYTSDLDRFPTGSPVLLRDGTIVQADGKVYLISQGSRMRIEDQGIFDRLFGPTQRTGALQVSTALLELHAAGEIIDYVDDTILGSTQPSSSPTPTPASTGYQATFDRMEPSSLVMLGGESQSVTLYFTNTGGPTWQPGSVWLAVTNQDGSASSFGSLDRIASTGAVGNGNSGSFTFTITAPTDQSGVITQNFTLYATQAGANVAIGSIGKFIIVKPRDGGQISEHNLPIAVRNVWKSLPITLKITNLSTDVTWLSRRTALEVYAADGTSSPFYDPNDWVRRDVPAVPINKSTIGPGETGEFKFTINPRGIPKGLHTLVFKLKLLDKDGKQVMLNGQSEWRKEIRVD